jgi:hypothetical protein
MLQNLVDKNYTVEWYDSFCQDGKLQRKMIAECRCSLSQSRLRLAKDSLKVSKEAQCYDIRIPDFLVVEEPGGYSHLAALGDFFFDCVVVVQEQPPIKLRLRCRVCSTCQC